jgi:hypothetical protein
MLLDTIQEGKYKLEIHRDDDPLDPRKDHDSLLATMVCFHSRYNLGDKHIFKDYQDLKDFLEDPASKEMVFSHPLYLLDHSDSGLSMSLKPFGCRRDSGQVGVIYITLAAIKKIFQVLQK